MQEVIGVRTYFAKQENSFFFVRQTMFQGVTAVSTPIDNAARPMDPRIARDAAGLGVSILPTPSKGTISLSKTIEVGTYCCPIEQYMRMLVAHIPIDREEEKEAKRREKIRDLVSDAVLAGVLILCPELLPLTVLESAATAAEVATRLVSEGFVATVADRAMSLLVEGAYSAFTDISNTVLKKTFVYITVTGVKESALAIKESMFPIAEEATSSERAFYQAHYFMMFADPTYSRRYQAELDRVKRAKLLKDLEALSTPKTIYLHGT